MPVKLVNIDPDLRSIPGKRRLVRTARAPEGVPFRFSKIPTPSVRAWQRSRVLLWRSHDSWQRLLLTEGGRRALARCSGDQGSAACA